MLKVCSFCTKQNHMKLYVSRQELGLSWYSYNHHGEKNSSSTYSSLVRQDLNMIKLDIRPQSCLNLVYVFTFICSVAAVPETVETGMMFPRRLLQVGRGEGEQDTQQGGALLVSQSSSTGISSSFLQSGKLQLVCRSDPLNSRTVTSLRLPLSRSTARGGSDWTQSKR